VSKNSHPSPSKTRFLDVFLWVHDGARHGLGFYKTLGTRPRQEKKKKNQKKVLKNKKLPSHTSFTYFMESFSYFLTLAQHNTKGFPVLHLLSPHFLFGHLLLVVTEVLFVQE
jgi:hypothetical protein